MYGVIVFFGYVFNMELGVLWVSSSEWYSKKWPWYEKMFKFYGSKRNEDGSERVDAT